jgi:hypothetical protein
MASYIDIVGFDIDAVSVIGGVKITYTGPATNASHHIRIIRCEIRNGKIAAGSGILVTGPYSTFNEFIENYIHHHGGHGLYISTADNLIRSNEVSYVDQIGIAVYLGGSGTGVDRNRVLFNRTHHNSQAASSDAGILISSGKDNEVRGNRSSYNSYGIRLYGGDPPDHLNPAVDTILADNYNWSNSVSAILVDAEATGTVQTNNSTTEPAAAYPASNDPFAGIHGEPAAVPVRHQVCDSAQKSP